MKILQAKSEPGRLSAAPSVKGLVAGAAAANVGRTLKRAFRQLVSEDINSGAWLQGCPFNVDFGVTKGKGEGSGTSVFFRDGDNVFRTYFTTGRGDEMLRTVWAFLDLTPLGRQET